MRNTVGIRGWVALATFFFSLSSIAQEPSKDKSHLVGPHLEMLIEKQTKLMKEIQTSNDSNAAWNKRQAEVKMQVSEILFELQRPAGKDGHQPVPAKARMGALSALKGLDTAQEIRSLSDYERFFRVISQYLAPGENPGKYGINRESGEVKITYANALENLGKGPGPREGWVTVTPDNKVTFTPKQITSLTSFDEIAKKARETKVHFEKCPHPAALRADLLALENEKSKLTAMVKAKSDSIEALEKSRDVINKEIEDHAKSFEDAAGAAFITYSAQGTPDKERSIRRKAYVKALAEDLLNIDFSPTEFKSKVERAIRRAPDYRHAQIFGNYSFRVETEAHWAGLQGALTKSTAKQGGLPQLGEALKTMGHIDLIVVRQADLDRLMEKLKDHTGVRDRMREQRNDLNSQILALSKARGTLEASVTSHNNRMAELQACIGPISSMIAEANDAVLSTHFRTKEGGIPKDSANKLDHAQDIYRRVQEKYGKSGKSK